MSLLNCNCNCRCNCTAVAVVASIILGIVAAFLQITGVITVTGAFLWVVLGIAIVYLGVLVLSVTANRAERPCLCDSLSTLLVGILGTVLFSIILLAVGIVATSVVSAILVGLLVAFFFLTVLATACYVRYLAGCGSCNNE